MQDTIRTVIRSVNWQLSWPWNIQSVNMINQKLFASPWKCLHQKFTRSLTLGLKDAMARNYQFIVGRWPWVSIDENGVNFWYIRGGLSFQQLFPCFKTSSQLIFSNNCSNSSTVRWLTARGCGINSGDNLGLWNYSIMAVTLVNFTILLPRLLLPYLSLFGEHHELSKYRGFQQTVSAFDCNSHWNNLFGFVSSWWLSRQPFNVQAERSAWENWLSCSWFQ